MLDPVQGRQTPQLAGAHEKRVDLRAAATAEAGVLRHDVERLSLGHARDVSLRRMPGPRKRRLLVLNQYYWPGVEATAHLLTELCEALADEFEIQVVTGVIRGHEDEPRRVVREGVAIVRVPSTSFERSKLVARAANYLTYLANALAYGLRVRGPTRSSA